MTRRRQGIVGLCGLLTVSWLALTPALASATTLSCGSVVTTNTVLHKDLGPCPGDGIVVGAANVILDLKGHSITGSATGAGVRDNGHSGVTVRNGVIRAFAKGVAISQAGSNQISGLKISGGDLADGIEITNTNGSVGSLNLVRSNTVTVGNGVGTSAISFFADTGSTQNFNRVTTNTIIAGGQATGVSVVSFNHSTQNSSDVSYNSVKGGAASSGVLLDAQYSGVQNDSSVHHNSVVVGGFGVGINVAVFQAVGQARTTAEYNQVQAGPDAGGIAFIGTGDNNVMRANLVDAGSFALYLPIEGQDNLVEGNLVVSRDKGQNAIFTSDGMGTRILRNRATSSGGSGIALFDVPTGVVGYNSTDDSAVDGITIQNSQAGLTIVGNSANFNGNLGINASAGVTDGGDNHARGNGNPTQCVNVVCEP